MVFCVSDIVVMDVGDNVAVLLEVSGLGNSSVLSGCSLGRFLLWCWLVVGCVAFLADDLLISAVVCCEKEGRLFLLVWVLCSDWVVLFGVSDVG